MIPMLLVLVAVALMFSHNLSDPFLSDDYILVSRASLNSSQVAASFTTPGGDGAFRPIGSLYFDIVRLWAGVDPLKWHLCGLTIHLTNCALLYVLAWLLWSNTFLASLSSILFGLNGTRPEVVTWTAGSFDLLACAFTLAAAICVFRRRNAPSYLSLALSLVFLTIAILCKESAYAAPVIVLGLAAASERLTDPRVRKFLVAATVLCAGLFTYRWILFRGPGGYVDATTGKSRILSLHLLPSMKAVFVRLWAVLLFPVNWDSNRVNATVAVAILMGCAVLVFFLSSTWLSNAALAGGDPALRGSPIRFRVAASLLAMTMCAEAPAITLALLGQSIQGSRILYLPSVSFCLLCAHLLSSARSKRSSTLGFVALALSTGMILVENLNAWHRAALRADEVCSNAAASPIRRVRPGRSRRQWTASSLQEWVCGMRGDESGTPSIAGERPTMKTARRWGAIAPPSRDKSGVTRDESGEIV